MATKKIRIAKLPTRAPEGLDKDKIVKKTKNLTKKIKKLVSLMSANKNNCLLVVLQGMDSSGKDGVSKSVFSRTSPTMVSAYGFKKPSDEEFAHDFLWRAHKQVPAKGEVRIFVRSHYEDVLIQRVHNWIDSRHVTARFNAINAFEKLLQVDNNTIVMKFFLNLSKDKQKEKLIERIEVPEKNFKHNDGDWEQRKYWDDYMDAYEDVLNRSDIKWINVPADQRWYRNYVVADHIVKRLTKLKETYPTLKEKPKVDIKNG